MKKAANNDQFYSIKAHYFGTKQTERSVHYSQIKNKQLNYMLTSLNSLHNSVKKVTSEKAEKSLSRTGSDRRSIPLGCEAWSHPRPPSCKG